MKKIPAATTREKIKAAAQQLIAVHGVSGVAVRDIVVEAGQRNMASLFYYFNNKDELIKELIVDASELMEGRRAAALVAQQASGESISVRDIVDIIASGAALDPATGGRNANVMRFLGAVLATHRHLFDEAIGNQYNKTYQACLDILRQLLPDIPKEILNQRLLFLSISTFNLLVARETGIAAGGHAAKYWGTNRTSYNILDFLCGGLTAPVCQEVQNQARQDSAQQRRMARHFGVLVS